jgi:hypothetical protein
MLDQKLREIAIGAVERLLGDYDSGDCAIYDEAYSLALDALRDHGVEDETAREIARDVAHSFARL